MYEHTTSSPSRSQAQQAPDDALSFNRVRMPWTPQRARIEAFMSPAQGSSLCLSSPTALFSPSEDGVDRLNPVHPLWRPPPPYGPASFLPHNGVQQSKYSRDDGVGFYYRPACPTQQYGYCTGPASSLSAVATSYDLPASSSAFFMGGSVATAPPLQRQRSTITPPRVLATPVRHRLTGTLHNNGSPSSSPSSSSSSPAEWSNRGARNISRSDQSLGQVHLPSLIRSWTRPHPPSLRTYSSDNDSMGATELPSGSSTSVHFSFMADLTPRPDSHMTANPGRQPTPRRARSRGRRVHRHQRSPSPASYSTFYSDDTDSTIAEEDNQFDTHPPSDPPTGTDHAQALLPPPPSQTRGTEAQVPTMTRRSSLEALAFVAAAARRAAQEPHRAPPDSQYTPMRSRSGRDCSSPSNTVGQQVGRVGNHRTEQDDACSDSEDVTDETTLGRAIKWRRLSISVL